MFGTKFIAFKAEKKNISKLALKTLVIIVLVVPFAIPIIAIPWTEGLAILIIFKMLIPCIVCGFTMFAFSDYFWHRFHLYDGQQQL